jgi:hypothetical protein
MTPAAHGPAPLAAGAGNNLEVLDDLGLRELVEADEAEEFADHAASLDRGS